MIPDFTPHLAPTELPPMISGVVTSNGRQTYRLTVGSFSGIYTYEPRCAVCTAPDEVVIEINEMASLGTPIKRIFVNAAQPAGLKMYSLRTHLRKHTPEYAMLDRAIRATGAAFGDADPDRVTGIQFSQLMLERGMAMLANGRMELKATDVLAAARFQHDLEVDESIINTDLYSEAMMIMLGKFYQSFGPARFNEVMWSLSADPRMAEIMRTIGMNPMDVVEAQPQVSSMKELVASL
jgi:hypothetical protein